jgi:thiol-disulfide isomerase/thioredoxin
MPSRRVRATVRSTALVASLCCLLTVSCDRADSPASPSIPRSLAELFGDVLHRADGSPVGVGGLENVAVIAIYFGSRSCPACQTFTPTLVDIYHELRQAGASFEVVYVSLDPSAEHMFAYMSSAEMPWVAVPWGGSHADGLLQLYGVQWIPHVVVIDGACNTLTVNGRQEIEQKGARAYDDWLARCAPG